MKLIAVPVSVGSVTIYAAKGRRWSWPLAAAFALALFAGLSLFTMIEG